jgi:hypothetical protein
MFTTTFEMKGLRITLSFFNLGLAGLGFVVRFVLGFGAVLVVVFVDLGFVVLVDRFLLGFALGLSLDISSPPWVMI